MIQNPILPGFNPDPSICRVGDDYYIATSTFEWYPGVQIHHSTDLENWSLVARPLQGAALLNLVGVPDSCGVWAPCLSWCDGLFYLCYTVVRRFDGNFKDTHNYLTTSPAVEGKWSDPVYLNSSGFDPSLFHDEDGRKWFLNMVWDHRPDRTFFAGITLQEYCPEKKRLLGKRKFIFKGTELDCTEGPHLYHYDEHYYLMTAEGGTGYEHAVTMARAQQIEGPYEVDPEGPVLASQFEPRHPLQRCGHGDLVETADGRFFLTHLCSRPLPGTRRSPLGRESGIQEVVRNADGWFRLKSGGQLPKVEVTGLVEDRELEPGNTIVEELDEFTAERLPDRYQWLRTPWPESFLSLTDRPGFLRLYGMESPGSHHHQALVARRQQHFRYEAITALSFEPDNFQQLAGLICYYNASKFHYCYISRDEDIGKHLAVMSCEGEILLEAVFPAYGSRIPLPEHVEVFLQARIDGAGLEFSWSADGEIWQAFPAGLDASVLSDEAGKGEGAQFTGAFVGMACHDVTGGRQPADFRFFSYSGMDQDS